MTFLGKLGIDFKLLIAQIINFLVLLYLLKIFLYKPLLKNLKERAEKAKKIEEGERALQRKKEEMKKREEEIIQKTKEKASQIIEESKEISKEEKERILERTEKEVREILKQARERAEKEVERIKEKEREKILEKTKEIVEKVLPRFFTKELHLRFIEKTIEKLQKVDFSKIKEKEITSVVVVSAFPLTKKEEKKLSQFFFKKLKNPAFQEKIDPGLIAGIKVVIDGFLIDGSLKEKIEKEI